MDSEPSLPENPQKRASLISQLFFWWLVPVIKLGTERTIRTDELYRVLEEDESGKLGRQLTTEWLKELDAPKNGKVTSLLRALLRVHGKNYMFLGLYPLLGDCFASIGQALCLFQLISFFQPENLMQPWQAYLYAMGIIAASVVRIFTIHVYNFGAKHIGMKCRIACCSLLYRKCLRLSNAATGKGTTGALVNLISNDVNRFDYSAQFLHYLWVAPLQCLLAFVILWIKFGPVSITGLSFFLFFIPVQGWLMRTFGTLRQRVAASTDKRIQFLSQVIHRIGVVKMYVWETRCLKLINKLRRTEIAGIRKTAYLKAVNLSIYYVSSKFLLLATLAAYTGLGYHLTAQKVFMALSMYDCIRNSMTMFLPMAIAHSSELYISIKRLQSFLSLEEKLHCQIERKTAQPCLSLKNFTATWSNTKEEIAVNNITFQLGQGQLLALIGPVGSGKSALLHAIMGELTLLFGTSSVVGNIAYVPQEPWIFSGSIRANIVCGQPFCPDRYWKVVESCALLKDFERLPYGDETLVGEAGGTLSGGQKARINLARALYVDADIYLLDDPLSAVDANVRRRLFEKAIDSFLKNKIRVLVTHNLHHLRQVDWILVMNSGRIEAQGTFADLQNSSVNIANHPYMMDKEETLEKTDVGKELTGKRRELALSNEVLPTKQLGDVPSTPEEVVTNLNVPWGVYAKYFHAGGGYFGTLFFLIVTAATQALFTSSDFWLTIWIRRDEKFTVQNFLLQTNISSVLDISFGGYGPDFFISVYSAIVLTIFSLTAVGAILFFHMAMKSSLNLHDTISRCVLQAPVSFFHENPVGRILNRFTKDTGIMDDFLPATFLECFMVFVGLLGGAVAIVVTNAWLIIPSLVFIVALVILWRYYSRTGRNVRRLEATTRSPVLSHLSSSLGGLKIIRAHQVESFFQQKFDELQDIHSSAWYMSIAVWRWFGTVLDLTGAVYIASVTVACVALRGIIDSRMVGLALSTTMQVISSFQFGVRQSVEAECQVTSVERILEYSALQSETDENESTSSTLDAQWPVKGEIRIKNLSLTYSKEASMALQDISCTIYPGEKVGVIGRTGAGKTSLVAAIFRLTEPEGSIEIDGVDTKTISLHQLRSRMSIVPQDPVLFTGTLRQNLDPFGAYSDVELWDALQKVNLKEAASKMAHGLDTTMFEETSNFSMGQRQLLSLARAILKRDRIVILDEATANVDSETDALVQLVAREHFADCTVLTITHRLTSVMTFDRVMVLDAGHLKEFGEPSRLLQDTSSMFSSLVQQSGMQSLK